jgi:hypothetical protein
MADALVTARAPTTTSVGSTAWPAGEVLRDIARGGVAGIVVGILVAGLGGRLVMRLATILHEGTVGFRTENGEVIGEITLGGTLALMTFGGLGMGLVAGTIWVIVSPWLPGSGLAPSSTATRWSSLCSSGSSASSASRSRSSMASWTPGCHARPGG